jgi:hypothetical protein
MPAIIGKSIKASDLHPWLRGGLDAETTLPVGARRLTGFTAEFEYGVLDAEAAADHVPSRPAYDVIEAVAALVERVPARTGVGIVEDYHGVH